MISHLFYSNQNRKVTKTLSRELQHYVLDRCNIAQPLKRYPAGKPYFDQRDLKKYCSISHASNFFVMLISPYICGIDIEIKGSHSYQISYQQFLHRNEHQYLVARPEQFLKIWTLKESYFKLLGKGLLLDLKSLNTVQGNKLIERHGNIWFYDICFDHTVVSSIAFYRPAKQMIIQCHKF